MATSTALIMLAEYLQTSYRPDCDSIEGEVQERNLREEEHSDAQTRLVQLLGLPANTQFIRANTELHVQLKPDRFRIPDVCVRLRNAPSERLLTTPPILCIEVLSPEDTVRRTRERVRDFLETGVPAVWMVDPAFAQRRLFRHGRSAGLDF